MSSNESASLMVVVATTTVALAATAGVMLWRKLRPSTTPASKYEKHVPLNHDEEVFLVFGMAPTTTGTWLVVKENNNNNNTLEEILRERIHKIVQANPWLVGSFVRLQESGKYAIGYNETVSEDVVDSLLESVVDERIHDQLPYEALVNQCAPYVLQQHKDLVQPLWKVTVVRTHHASDEKALLLVSLSHGVGDGHTYYSIWNMLLKGTVYPMRVQRVTDAKQRQAAAMGGNTEEAGVLSSLGVVFTTVRGFFYSQWCLFWNIRSGLCHGRLFLVDTDKMKRCKQQALQEKNQDANDDVSKKKTTTTTAQKFVSTNDVITSWCLTHAATEHNLMAINMRGRVKGLDADLVGNYQTAIYYRNPWDVRSPWLIRQSVERLQRVVTAAHETFDSKVMCFKPYTVMTNWSTFCDLGAPEVVNGPFDVLLHLPFYRLKSVFPCTMANIVIFQARPNRTAVLVAGTPKLIQGWNNQKAPFEADEPFMACE